MVSGRAMAPRVWLRSVEDADLDVFFAHQSDPTATAMAAFPARDRDQFVAHWTKIRADDTAILRTIVAGDPGEVVAGNIVSWLQDGRRLVGYWVGREHWGRGVATAALARFVDEVTTRPLDAHVAVHNAASIKVLQKCGFARDRVQEQNAPAPTDGIEEYIFVLDD